mmetsp:Transcript_11903/g.32566  ORF Transcript_11903/g.32566 Transcript_11903/m.32566 type:complete len:207 (+) Transcript_11903:530-1150(+)
MGRSEAKSAKRRCATTVKRSPPSASRPSSPASRPSMICASTRSAATTTSSSSLRSASKIGAKSLCSVSPRSICAGLCSSSMQTHCRHAVPTTRLSWRMDSRSWSTSAPTGAPPPTCTISSRPPLISTAMRAISSSWSSMHCSVPRSTAGRIASQRPSGPPGRPWRTSRCTNWCSQQSAVRREQASLAEQQRTRISAVSATICRAPS